MPSPSRSSVVRVGDTHLVQVQPNVPGPNPLGDGHYRFAMRSFDSGSGDNAAIAIAGPTGMAIYADPPCANTSFCLTQVRRGPPGRSPGAAGQILQLRLVDIGDSSRPGTVQIVPPVESSVSSFTGCTATGPTGGAPTGCRITLRYDYASGTGRPWGTTSWQAGLQGSPVRLIH